MMHSASSGKGKPTLEFLLKQIVHRFQHDVLNHLPDAAFVFIYQLKCIINNNPTFNQDEFSALFSKILLEEFNDKFEKLSFSFIAYRKKKILTTLINSQKTINDTELPGILKMQITTSINCAKKTVNKKNKEAFESNLKEHCEETTSIICDEIISIINSDEFQKKCSPLTTLDEAKTILKNLLKQSSHARLKEFLEADPELLNEVIDEIIEPILIEHYFLLRAQTQTATPSRITQCLHKLFGNENEKDETAIHIDLIKLLNNEDDSKTTLKALKALFTQFPNQQQFIARKKYTVQNPKRTIQLSHHLLISDPLMDHPSKKQNLKTPKERQYEIYGENDQTVSNMKVEIFRCFGQIQIAEDEFIFTKYSNSTLPNSYTKGLIAKPMLIKMTGPFSHEEARKMQEHNKRIALIFPHLGMKEPILIQKGEGLYNTYFILIMKDLGKSMAYYTYNEKKQCANNFFPIDKRINLMAKSCASLADVHNAGFAHKDVKDGNTTEYGLIDFDDASPVSDQGEKCQLLFDISFPQDNKIILDAKKRKEYLDTIQLEQDVHCAIVCNQDEIFFINKLEERIFKIIDKDHAKFLEIKKLLSTSSAPPNFVAPETLASISRETVDEKTKTRHIFINYNGTEAYLAPEVYFEGAAIMPLSQKSDIFAKGIEILRILISLPIYRDNAYEIASQLPNTMDGVDISKVKTIILSMLDPDPKNRPTIQDVSIDLSIIDRVLHRKKQKKLEEMSTDPSSPSIHKTRRASTTLVQLQKEQSKTEDKKESKKEKKAEKKKLLKSLNTAPLFSSESPPSSPSLVRALGLFGLNKKSASKLSSSSSNLQTGRNTTGNTTN